MLIKHNILNSFVFGDKDNKKAGKLKAKKLKAKSKLLPEKSF